MKTIAITLIAIMLSGIAGLGCALAQEETPAITPPAITARLIPHSLQRAHEPV